MLQRHHFGYQTEIAIHNGSSAAEIPRNKSTIPAQSVHKNMATI